MPRLRYLSHTTFLSYIHKLLYLCQLKGRKKWKWLNVLSIYDLTAESPSYGKSKTVNYTNSLWCFINNHKTKLRRLSNSKSLWSVIENLTTVKSLTTCFNDSVQCHQKFNSSKINWRPQNPTFKPSNESQKQIEIQKSSKLSINIIRRKTKNITPWTVLEPTTLSTIAKILCTY